MTATRDLLTPRQREALADVLTSCVVSELLDPSDPLWLISAWISDIPLIDNSGGSFESLAPEWPRGPVSISRVLETRLRLSGKVFIAMRDDTHNQLFAKQLQYLEEQHHGTLRWVLAPDLHQKCLCGKRYALRGSMNFTWNGLNAKEEQMTLTTAEAEVRKLRFELQDRWQNALS
jgi:hypothetical protein